MDKDLNELEQLADETHADLQEKPKKASTREVNGLASDVKENGEEDLGMASIEVTTHASLNTASAATLNDN